MTRCGQGQRNSPVFLNKLIALILKDMPHNSAYNFADDIVIATETVQQHYEALEKLFENCQKLNGCYRFRLAVYVSAQVR